MSSVPLVPPRPQRAQAGPTAVNDLGPQVPPRPSRKTDPSPAREANARSPLNQPPTAMSNAQGGYGHTNLAPSDLPRRPPSVSSMPSIGQEGVEYASYDQLPPEAHGAKGDSSSDPAAAVQQTRHADVPMHAPKASVPQSTAKTRISTVTRTDSSQAAAAGIGKAVGDDDFHTPAAATTNLPDAPAAAAADSSLKRVPSREPHPLKAKSSFNLSNPILSSASGTPRPSSIHSQSEPVHGIPEIGMQVPMYPNAGDVQAPSPSPYHAQFPAGIGFFNDGSSRAHVRKRSSRQEFGPPGSYGLHGHSGQEPGDKFERDWIAKHPDIAAREGYNAYGGLQPRPATALSTDQLNKLVREGDDIGMGTDHKMIGTPDREIGYLASDEYTSRLSSPKPSPAPLTELRKRPSSGTHPAMESPLRKTIFSLHPSGHDDAIESEDDPVIHIHPPARRMSKVTGGGEADGALDLGPEGGNTAEEGGWIDERGPGIPILASDEILKRPGSAFMLPAVSPEVERADDDIPPSRRSSLQLSRPSSRPSSMHGHHAFGGPLHRFVSQEDHYGSGMGTPLEEIEEYEPLFPEDEGKAGGASKAQKEKATLRPTLAAHHFPSQDIWEDTPPSLQFTANVDTPEPQGSGFAGAEKPKSAALFETPEQEQKRRTQNPDDMTSDKKTFAKPHFRGVDSELERPGIQRFPSQDIWEDTPDSMRLVTTVSSPQTNDPKSPPDDRPTTSALPGSQDDANARATTGMSQIFRPQIPGRPQPRSKLHQEVKPDVSQKSDPREEAVPDLGVTSKAKGAGLADKPKPSIPTRPAKYASADQSDSSGAPLAKSASATSDGSGTSSDTVTSPPAIKAKPAVPARPPQNKFAGLRANFMNDLNSRLQLGPQAAAPKTAEPEAADLTTESVPLADARKGRAKGPARRKPAASPSATDDQHSHAFSLCPATTVWHIDEQDELRVPVSDSGAAELDRAIASNEATNLEGTPPAASAHLQSPVGAEGDATPPSISHAAQSEQKAVQSELERSLAGAEAAPASADEVQEKHFASKTVQTGEHQMTTHHPSGETESMTAYVGAKAPEEGSVVIRDGEEVGNTD